jgi:hypothetical protein
VPVQLIYGILVYGRMEKRTAKAQRTPREEGLIGFLHQSSMFLPNWDAPV